MFNSQLIKELLAKVLELKGKLEETMSTISEWAAKEKADLTAIKDTLNGVATGVNSLHDKITQLQNTPGTVSAEDQALLDAIESDSAALVTQAQQIKTS